MKKIFRMGLLAVASLGIYSCSDDVAGEMAGPGSSDGLTDGFVSFKINTAENNSTSHFKNNAAANTSVATRAEGDNYDKGAEGEYKVSNTIGANAVFFFDDSDDYLNYSLLQLTNGGEEQEIGDDHTHAGTDKETLYKARIIKAKDTKLAKCIVILNADPESIKALAAEMENPVNDNTLAGFMQKKQELTQNSATGAYSDDNLGRYGDFFTMSNTVYATDNSIEKAVGITQDQIFTTMEEAEKNPITVHVERVVAKVELGLASSLEGNNIQVADEGNTLPVKSEKDKDAVNTKWGFRIKGWKLNGTETATYWVKNLGDDVNSSSDKFGSWEATMANGVEPWNDLSRLRSYWAVDPHYNIEDAQKYPNQYRKAADNDEISFGTSGVDRGLKNDLVLKYISYNGIGETFNAAPQYAPENTFAYDWFETGSGYDYKGYDYKRTSTHILIAAELLLGDEELGGETTPQDKYGYEGKYWLGENKDELINYMVEAVLLYDNPSYTLYAKMGEGEKKQVTGANASEYFDLVDPANIEGGDGRVKLSLKENVTLYADDEEKGLDEILVKAIEVVGTAKHFKEGKMYYSIPISHMSADNIASKDDPGYVYQYNVGRYGIVRNHWYKINVKSINNPGVPVDDPDQPIIPNDDPDEGAYASFDIVIIPWHVIEDQNVEL